MEQIIDVTTGEILSTPADEINIEYRLSKEVAIDWIGHVIRCGQLLIEQKAKLSHGEWLPWVMQYCDMSEQQARRYMQVAEAYRSRGFDFNGIDSIKGILRLLADPTELKGTGVDEKPIQGKFFKTDWVRILSALRFYPDYADICEKIDKMLAKKEKKHAPKSLRVGDNS
jgi:hypothetical protein